MKRFLAASAALCFAFPAFADTTIIPDANLRVAGYAAHSGSISPFPGRQSTPQYIGLASNFTDPTYDDYQSDVTYLVFSSNAPFGLHEVRSRNVVGNYEAYSASKLPQPAISTFAEITPFGGGAFDHIKDGEIPGTDMLTQLPGFHSEVNATYKYYFSGFVPGQIGINNISVLLNGNTDNYFSNSEELSQNYARVTFIDSDTDQLSYSNVGYFNELFGQANRAFSNVSVFQTDANFQPENMVANYFTICGIFLSNGCGSKNFSLSFNLSGVDGHYAGFITLDSVSNVDSNAFSQSGRPDIASRYFAYSKIDPILSFGGSFLSEHPGATFSFSPGVGNGVAPIPEPASWALMITGFGLTGGAMRRRRAMRPRLA